MAGEASATAVAVAALGYPYPLQPQALDIAAVRRQQGLQRPKATVPAAAFLQPVWPSSSSSTASAAQRRQSSLLQAKDDAGTPDPQATSSGPRAIPASSAGFCALAFVASAGLVLRDLSRRGRGQRLALAAQDRDFGRGNRNDGPRVRFNRSEASDDREFGIGNRDDGPRERFNRSDASDDRGFGRGNRDDGPRGRFNRAEGSDDREFGRGNRKDGPRGHFNRSDSSGSRRGRDDGRDRGGRGGVPKWYRAGRGGRPWRNEDELNDVMSELALPAAPRRLPDIRGMPPVGVAGGPSQEEIEAIIEDMVPSPNRRDRPGQFDPHSDDPLTKGIDVMLMQQNQNLVCCRGCGIPLQTHDNSNVGYVKFSYYLEMWSTKRHRKILCTRCQDLQQGLLRPIVKETLGPRAMEADNEELKEKLVGFGGHVIDADALSRQLRSIRHRKCLVVYILDMLDFNGSFVRHFRDIIGRNPTVVIGTKLDLLPPRTDEEEIKNWLGYCLWKRKLRTVDIRMCSSITGRGIKQACNAIIEARKGLDVFVVGAANAGKSMFITKFLDYLERRYPQGRVEDCDRPLVSRTPGTTLGTMQLRAFRRSATSPVWSCLYDTPGVHLPRSMQNLLPVEVYDTVQPTRPYAVQIRRPAKDIMAALRGSDQLLTTEVAQEWLKKPVRYLWGVEGQPPVAAVEVVPPILPSMELGFVCRDGLHLQCVAVADIEHRGLGKMENQLDGAGDTLPPPEGLDFTQLSYIKTPYKLSAEGEVLADVCLAGFGYVAVGVKAVSEDAADRPVELPTIRLRVYGPKNLRVNVSQFPMPIYGVPGKVAPPEEIEEKPELPVEDTSHIIPPRRSGVSDEDEWRHSGKHPLADIFASRDKERKERAAGALPAGDEAEDKSDESIGTTLRKPGFSAAGGRTAVLHEDDDDDFGDPTLRRPGAGAFGGDGDPTRRRPGAEAFGGDGDPTRRRPGAGAFGGDADPTLRRPGAGARGGDDGSTRRRGAAGSMGNEDEMWSPRMGGIAFGDDDDSLQLPDLGFDEDDDLLPDEGPGAGSKWRAKAVGGGSFMDASSGAFDFDDQYMSFEGSGAFSGGDAAWEAGADAKDASKKVAGGVAVAEKPNAKSNGKKSRGAEAVEKQGAAAVVKPPKKKVKAKTGSAAGVGRSTGGANGLLMRRIRS
eukprot:TRINITY_DN16388_c0_g1_i1.p1 TRINITY_DN16388_c0_g1~~TRINITY_DN16388_c0_g1_i1.p1  ORF type:complete len:1165 (-),score=282.55 TRINITY_DN16388_c0_g1_i1:215-3709(-)